MNAPNLPADRAITTPSGGQLTDPWWLFFDSIVKWLRANGGTIYTTLAQRTVVTTRGYRSPGSVADGTVDYETDSGTPYQMRSGSWVRVGQTTFYGLWADLPAVTAAPDGSVYVVTDRNNIEYQLQGGAWVYKSGTYQRTQSQLAALIATLGANDVGLRIAVTDYAHVLWCTAATTTDWAPEDDHRAGEITFFDVAPTGNGWKLIDGNGDDGSAIGAGHPIRILKKDGTTRSNTTAAAMNAGVYLRGANAYNGAVTPPTVPTSSTPTFTGTPGTTGAASAGIQPSGPNSSTLTLASHTHSFTPAGTVSTPVISLPGDPVAFSDALPYIRK